MKQVTTAWGDKFKLLIEQEEGSYPDIIMKYLEYISKEEKKLNDRLHGNADT